MTEPTSTVHIRRVAMLTACISAGIILVSCGTTESQPNAPSPTRTTPAPSGRDGAVTLTGTPRAVTTGLQAPWSVVFRDGTALVSERDARAAGKAADGVYVP